MTGLSVGLPTSPASPSEKVVGADRVMALLVLLAEHPDGLSLDEIATLLDSPKSTVHRNLSILRRHGFAETAGQGHYMLGNEFLRLAFQHHEARPDHIRVRSTLASLAQRFGETAHYSVLQGRQVVYRAKADPPTGGVRLTSMVGGTNPAHLTAVGKVLLAYELPNLEAVLEWVGATPLEGRTPHSITSPSKLHETLKKVRQDGYAVDDQESELGINCVALPVFMNSPSRPSGAISVSGVAFRTPLATLVDQISTIRAVIDGTAQ